MQSSFTRHTALRIALSALLACGAQLAHAHAHPIHETPNPGATVGLSQDSVSIDFDDELEPSFSSLKVTDAHGRSVSAGASVVDPGNRRHLTVTLKPLTPGVYHVVWIAVAADTHRTHGEYSFTAK